MREEVEALLIADADNEDFYIETVPGRNPGRGIFYGVNVEERFVLNSENCGRKAPNDRCLYLSCSQTSKSAFFTEDFEDSWCRRGAWRG